MRDAVCRRGWPRRHRPGSARSTSSSSAPAPPGSPRRWRRDRCAACSIVTKGTLAAGSTAWAQGGLAAVLDPTDSLENHVRDTLAAGAGLCDEAVVRELVAEAPTAIRYLMRLGAAFDPPATTATGRRSAARVGTATTASSIPAAIAAAPRCSARSTSRPSPPASRCSSGRSPSTSSSARASDGRRQAVRHPGRDARRRRPGGVGRRRAGACRCARDRWLRAGVRRRRRTRRR